MGRWGWAAVAGLWVAVAAEASGPCPHPYFPMSDGLAFTYKAGRSEVRVHFTDVKQAEGGQTGTLHVANKGKDGTTEATCGEGGIHTQLGGIEGAALSMSGMDVRVLSSEGIAMPPPEQMIEGATWSNSLALELRPPSGSKLPFGVVKTRFKKESLIEGKETIEVAGQSWEALRVKNKITAMAGTAGERTMESMMWLAPEVGILRIKTGDVVDLELLKVERPDTQPRAEAPKAKSTGSGGSK